MWLHIWCDILQSGFSFSFTFQLIIYIVDLRSRDDSNNFLLREKSAILYANNTPSLASPLYINKSMRFYFHFPFQTIYITLLFFFRFWIVVFQLHAGSIWFFIPIFSHTPNTSYNGEVSCWFPQYQKTASGQMANIKVFPFKLGQYPRGWSPACGGSSPSSWSPHTRPTWPPSWPRPKWTWPSTQPRTSRSRPRSSTGPTAAAPPMPSSRYFKKNLNKPPLWKCKQTFT